MLPDPFLSSDFVSLLLGEFYTREREDQLPDLASDKEPGPAKKSGGRAKITSCTPRTAEDGRGITAGTLIAFWVCGYMFPPLKLIRLESTTMVRFCEVSLVGSPS
jgi:hypothetical protein